MKFTDVFPGLREGAVLFATYVAAEYVLEKVSPADAVAKAAAHGKAAEHHTH